MPRTVAQEFEEVYLGMLKRFSEENPDLVTKNDVEKLTAINRVKRNTAVLDILSKSQFDGEEEEDGLRMALVFWTYGIYSMLKPGGCEPEKLRAGFDKSFGANKDFYLEGARHLCRLHRSTLG